MTTEVEAAKVCGKCGCDCARGCVEKFSASHELLQTLCYECDRGERYDAFERTGRLHTWLVTDATMVVFYADEARVRRDPGPHRLRLARRVDAAAKTIHEAIKRFERVVWFGGLQAKVRAARVRGMKSTEVPSAHGPVTLLAWSCAGRTLITLDAPTCTVTTITAEDERQPRMGMQGVDATESEALGLLDAVADAWERRAIEVRPDEKVGI